MTPPPGVQGDSVVLVGPMGAGKSSVARELARLTARRWEDTDRLIVQRVGRTVLEIFAREGEDHFRRLETDVLRSLAEQRRLVVATGGGIVTRPENPPLLRALGCVVFLTADEEVLFERVSRNHQRPLLQTPDPRATLGELLRWRRPLYEECAHATVDTSRGSHAAVAQAVLTAARQFFATAGQATVPS